MCICGWETGVYECSVLIINAILLMLFSISYINDNCLFIIMCLGKYFPTPEVGVVPETIKDHDVVPQGNNY